MNVIDNNEFKMSLILHLFIYVNLSSTTNGNYMLNTCLFLNDNWYEYLNHFFFLIQTLSVTLLLCILYFVNAYFNNDIFLNCGAGDRKIKKINKQKDIIG